jgi:hypothetical protein
MSVGRLDGLFHEAFKRSFIVVDGGGGAGGGEPGDWPLSGDVDMPE